MTPAILGLSGPTLTADEVALFRACDPAGYILFGRNIVDPRQLRALTQSLRDLSGRDHLPILVDQEGGRVARLGPPHWAGFPKAAIFDRLYDIAPITAMAAARANAVAMALVLRDVGITVNCAPLLDLRHPDAHDIVGDRAYGDDPARVGALGRAVLEGLAAGGVAGVIKHLPGHGRASVDSHASLPIVDADDGELERDIAPFAALAHAPFAMTAHVLYPAWDAGRPATLSQRVIDGVIRERIGFGGILSSDDIDMGALAGPIGERAVAALGAGCDLVLQCSGRITEMTALVDAIGDGRSATMQERLASAMASTRMIATDLSVDEAIAHRDAYLAIDPAFVPIARTELETPRVSG